MLRILFVLATLAVVNGNKESCKVECDRNFSRNSFNQFSLLAPVCHRGCDMYILAFISTSTNPHNGRITQQKLNESPQHDEEDNLLISMKNKSGSKTTAEPTLEPVQDYPVKVSDHVTTKVPNGHKSSTSPRKSANSIKVLEAAHENETGQDESKEEIEKKFLVKIEQAKHTCRHACIIAYGELSEVEACAVGCNFQSKTDHSRDSEESDFGKSAISSLKKIESSIVNFIGYIGHFVRVSWTSTFPKKKEPTRNIEYGSENSIKPQLVPLLFPGVNLKSTFPKDHLTRYNTLKPEMMHMLQSFRNDFVLQPDLFENIDKSMNGLLADKVAHKFTNIKSDRQHKLHLGEPRKNEQKFYLEGIVHYERNANRATAKQHKENKHAKWDEARQPPWMKSPEIRQSLDILECISRKSGLPRWFIAFTMFSSIPVTLWLCFSLTAPPDESKVSKTKVVDPENTLDCAHIADEKCRLMQDYDDCVKPRVEII